MSASTTLPSRNPGLELISFVCECADLDCGSHIEVSPQEYLGVRASRRQFVVREGHVFPDVERIVESRDRYVVVENFVRGEVAAALDDQGQAAYVRIALADE
jgi:hypothetical protein